MTLSIQAVANATPASNAEYLYNLKTTLLASGAWTLKGSGNGTSFDNTGSTDYWSSAANINHNKAWCRLLSSTGQEIVFQFNASAGLRWKYSPSAGFVGGSPSATQTPSATDENFICGGGVDATPSFDTVFSDTPGTQQVYADGTSTPPVFYSIGYDNGGSDPKHAIAFDVAQNLEAGDPDACMMFAVGGGEISGAMLAASLCNPSANGCPKGWLYQDNRSGGFVAIPMLALSDSGGNTSPGGGVTSLRNGKDPTLAITYFRSSRSSAPQGYKGTSKLFRWATVQRSTPKAGHVLVDNDRMLAGDVYCVWLASAGAWT